MGKNINAKKITWTPNSIEELRRLLEIEPGDETEEEEGGPGLEYPWPLVVKEYAITYNDQGNAVVDITLGFDDVVGAEDYEVRISKVPTPPESTGGPADPEWSAVLSIPITGQLSSLSTTHMYDFTLEDTITRIYYVEQTAATTMRISMVTARPNPEIEAPDQMELLLSEPVVLATVTGAYSGVNPWIYVTPYDDHDFDTNNKKRLIAYDYVDSATGNVCVYGILHDETNTVLDAETIMTGTTTSTFKYGYLYGYEWNEDTESGGYQGGLCFVESLGSGATTANVGTVMVNSDEFSYAGGSDTIDTTAYADAQDAFFAVVTDGGRFGFGFGQLNKNAAGATVDGLWSSGTSFAVVKTTSSGVGGVEFVETLSITGVYDEEPGSEPGVSRTYGFANQRSGYGSGSDREQIQLLGYGDLDEVIYKAHLYYSSTFNYWTLSYAFLGDGIDDLMPQSGSAYPSDRGVRFSATHDSKLYYSYSGESGYEGTVPTRTEDGRYAFWGDDTALAASTIMGYEQIASDQNFGEQNIIFAVVTEPTEGEDAENVVFKIFAHRFQGTTSG